MRRSDALAILSRDHHQALVVAQRLRRATVESADAERRRFLAFWSSEGRAHFRSEEDLLFPAYAPHGDPHHPLLERALGDHVAIRARVAQLAAAAEVTPESLHALGSELAAHVRLEERELFPVIEASMGSDELLVLARALAHPTPARRGSDPGD